MAGKTYVGNELELFEKAENWKKYYGSTVKPYLKGRVLEVGAGIGGTTKYLCDGSQQEWVCLEPDLKLANSINFLIESHNLPDICRLVNGTISALKTDDFYDVVIYMDVIEHIENDTEELQNVCHHLKTGGKLIILVPAHQWLYSPFDKSIGHFRRYNKKTLLNVIPEVFKTKELVYLDSAGLLASAANAFLLKQSSPDEKQIRFWDQILVNISKVTDVITFNQVGKSLLGIWEK